MRHEGAFDQREEAALDLCRGRVLAVGSGAGAHSLRLQERMGRKRALTSITALDAQPGLVDLARRRGVADARTGDVVGEPFGWLYVDHRTLRAVCRAKGWSCQVVVEDGPDYLVRISRAP